MYYKQFLKSINKADDSIRSFGHLIRVTEGVVFIDNEATELKTLEEARSYIKNKKYEESLKQEVTNEIYEDITENKVASIIKEFYDVKITDTLIESYIDLASSKIFTVDPVVQKIRSLNKVDEIVENKIHYKLNDDAVVAINEDTQKQLNNLLANQKEIIEYMRECKDNFFYVVNKIKE